MKSLLVVTTLILLIFQHSLAAPTEKRQLAALIGGLMGSGDSGNPSDSIIEPDWKTIDYDEIKLDASEIEMLPSELYMKVLECVKKCMESLPKNSYRDKCIANTCDIY